MLFAHGAVWCQAPKCKILKINKKNKGSLLPVMKVFSEEGKGRATSQRPQIQSVVCGGVIAHSARIVNALTVQDAAGGGKFGMERWGL